MDIRLKYHFLLSNDQQGAATLPEKNASDEQDSVKPTKSTDGKGADETATAELAVQVEEYK